MAKHIFASISLTVRDRAISSKVSTHRVSEHRTLGNFSKNFPLPKNGGHFEFSNFSKNGKTRICFYLLNRVRQRFRRNFRPTGYPSNVLLAISKNFPLPKNAGHFEISNFCQKWQNTKLLLSP